VVPAAAAAAVLVRLPLLGAPVTPDEAGFLVIARGWSGPGAALYGDYWVDRPPLLLMLFQAAHLTGGLVPLRLLGALAVVVTVLASARAGRLLAGPRAGAWTAVLTAALLSSPLLQAHQVNGELLAVPFVAVGVLAMVAALQGEARGRDAALAAASGAAGAAALLVKQNIADALVFDVVLLSALVVMGSLPARRALRLGAWVAAGVAVTTWTVLAWAWFRGAGPVEVLEATYLFRLEAVSVIADSEEGTATRAGTLVVAWAGSGLAVAMLVLLARTVTRQSAALLTLSAVALVDLVSVGLGGSFWPHYLVQPAVPLALALGVLAGERADPRRGRRHAGATPLVAGLVIVSSALALLVEVPRVLRGPDPLPARIGHAVGAAALPGDTLTTLYGRPHVNHTSGLASPYPYLWSLPTRVRDPGLGELETLMRSDRRPTWLVLGRETEAWGPSLGVDAVVREHYVPVATRGGLTVHLRRDAERPDPPL
jgi:4-amino-4-deoxy-L-arabinose transferase-like glycosyltransferase